VPDWQQYDTDLCLIRVFRRTSGKLRSIVRYFADDKILITQAFILGPITALLETKAFHGLDSIGLKTYYDDFSAARAEFPGVYCSLIQLSMQPAAQILGR
jgi:hypothetical protein